MAFAVDVPAWAGPAVVVESVAGFVETAAPVWVVDADWLAARAAAAIASGAVPLADTVEFAADVGVAVTAAGITSATAMGVAATAPVVSCDDDTVESVAEAAVELSLDEDVSVDGVGSSCEEADLDRGRGGAFALGSALAAGPLELASWLPDVFAGAFADALSRHRLLSAAEE